jgi:hypothetical protein
MRRVSMTILCTLAAGFLTLPVQGQDKAVNLFNGKDLTGWKVKGDNQAKSKWTVGKATVDDNGKLVVGPAGSTPDDQHLINAAGGGVDLFSEPKFGDGTYEIEVMVPKGSNSGLYLMGEYEIQVLDSFGKAKVGPGDLGGIYGAAAPLLNAAKKPGEWQKFVIEYQAPKFTDGKKTANARVVKVTLNGQVIHENIEIKGATGGALTGKEAATGPLMIQGDHGTVALRNVKFIPK